MQSTLCYGCDFNQVSADVERPTLHRAPSESSKRAILNKWLEFLFLPPSHTWPDHKWCEISLCSLHFDEQDFCDRESLRKTLNDDAVPTKNRPNGRGQFDLFRQSDTDAGNSSGSSAMEEQVPEEPSTSASERVVEEEVPSTHYKVPTLNLPDIPSLGVASKLQFNVDRSLKQVIGLPIRWNSNPRSDKLHKVAKFHQQPGQKCMDIKPPVVEYSQNKDDSLAGEFFRTNILNSKRSVQKRHYSKRITAACLVLQGIDNDAYRLIRESFTLPGQRTFNQIRQGIPLPAGMSKAVLNGMKARISTMSEIEKLCVLMFDKMPLHKHLDYDPILDQILGYQDVGGNRCPIFADHALVFMACGLISKWKQPVAFHLCRIISKGNLEDALKTTVLALQDIGLKVVAIVSDPVQSNVLTSLSSATKSLLDRDPTIQIGNEKIFVFVDAPHLLRVLRNNFLLYDVEFTWLGEEKKVAKFDVMKEFVEFDKNQMIPDSFLTDRHLNPNSTEKMDNKLAAQLFHRTVYYGLSTFSLVCSDAEHLAEFVNLVDRLSSTFILFSNDGGGNYRGIVRDGSVHHKFWNVMIQHLVDWKFVLRSPRSEQPQSNCFDFWRQNLVAVQGLWKEVRALGVQRLETRKINKDPLRHFFDCIRKQGGCNTMISSKSFVEIFKILCLNSIIQKFISKRGNNVQKDIATLTEVLNSTPEDENNDSLDTVARVDHTSTSLASVSSAYKEVEVCTQWILKSTFPTSSEKAFGSAPNFLALFLRIHKNFEFVTSCFFCYRSIYHCLHPMLPSGKVTCDKCFTLNSFLALEMVKLYEHILCELQKSGHMSQLTKKLKECVKSIPFNRLSCNKHNDVLQDRIIDFLIQTAIKDFCFQVNGCISAHTGKTKPHKLI